MTVSLAPEAPPPDDPRRLLLSLPDDPFSPPDPRVLRRLLARRRETVGHCLALLDTAQGRERPPRRGFQAHYWIALVGQWREAAAVNVLCRWLDTPWAFGGIELVHALTRIGSPAIEPLLFVAFDGHQPQRARARAVRALASVGVAALEYGDDRDWRGDARAHYDEVVAALRVVVARAEDESVDVVTEAAAGLCHLRHGPSWPEIEALFWRGLVEDTEVLCARQALALMHARAFDFRLGAYRAPMIQPE